MEIDEDRGVRAARGDGRSNGAENGDGVVRLVEQSRRVREDLEGLVGAVVDARSEWEERLRARLAERPYLGLAAAAGLGYVLGAGASPYLVRATFGLGTRVAFALMMRRLATTLARSPEGA